MWIKCIINIRIEKEKNKHEIETFCMNTLCLYIIVKENSYILHVFNFVILRFHKKKCNTVINYLRYFVFIVNF